MECRVLIGYTFWTVQAVWGECSCSWSLHRKLKKLKLHDLTWCCANFAVWFEVLGDRRRVDPEIGHENVEIVQAGHLKCLQYGLSCRGKGIQELVIA